MSSSGKSLAGGVDPPEGSRRVPGAVTGTGAVSLA